MPATRPPERTPLGTLVTDDVDEAARLLRAGELVAFPTETVYGLGALAHDADALRRVFRAKGRPGDNPLIVHASSMEGLGDVVSSWSSEARAFATMWPGPLTLVLPRHLSLPGEVSAGRSTVGVRVPDHARARALLAAVGAPVAAPSANRSGRPSATRVEDVLQDLDGLVACVLRDADARRVGLESTVVDCTSAPPSVLRPGAVTLDALRSVVAETLGAPVSDEAAAHSPGTRHPHYAPRARVVLSSSTDAAPVPDAAWIGVGNAPPGFAAVAAVPDVASYGAGLYAFFRDCDAAGVSLIVCAPVPERGLGVALMDRLRRAADASR